MEGRQLLEHWKNLAQIELEEARERAAIATAKLLHIEERLATYPEITEAVEAL